MNNELIRRIESMQSTVFVAANAEQHKTLETLRVLLSDCKAALSQQEAEPVEECRDCMELIEDRDSWEERATALADAVGEYFGVPVGEHTSANCPINEAMKILNGEYQTPAVDKAWSRFQAAINAPQPVASMPSKEKMRELFTIYHELPYNPKSERYRFEHFYNAISKEPGK